MDEEFFEHLILLGLVRPAAIDQNTGEMLYEFSEDLQEYAPEVFNHILNQHVNDIYSLWEAGFVSMDITDSNPLVRITEKALDEDQVNKLSSYMQQVIREIVRISRIDDSGE